MMNHPILIHAIRSGTAANAPNTALRRETKTCVSIYPYCTSVNANAAGIAALSALAYLTSALGMNLYIADNTNVTTMAKISHISIFFKIPKTSRFIPRISMN